jgi:hypothetical protein
MSSSKRVYDGRCAGLHNNKFEGIEHSPDERVWSFEIVCLIAPKVLNFAQSSTHYANRFIAKLQYTRETFTERYTRQTEDQDLDPFPQKKPCDWKEEKAF